MGRLSFLTLEKYLSGPKKPAIGSARPGFQENHDIDANYFQLAGSVMSSVSNSMLAGEALVDLAAELDALRDRLAPETDSGTLAAAAARFDRLLFAFRSRLQEADKERAEDFRNVLTTLNDAFVYFSQTGERQNSKWKELQSSLRVATRSDDFTAVKRQLSQVIGNMDRELKEEQQQTAEALSLIGGEIQAAEETAPKRVPGKGDKAEAIERLKAENLPDLPLKVYAVMFLVGTLPALQDRHGTRFAEGLMEELARKRVRKLLPRCEVFRWSPKSIVARWESPQDLPVVTGMVANASKQPLSYRAFVGTRMAAFNVAYHTLVAGLNPGTVIVDTLNRFAGSM